MRAVVVGEEAVLIECADLDEMRAVHAAALARAGDLGVGDVVPAARTVLLDGVADPHEVARQVTGWELRPPDTLAGEVVEVPVRYDGPDLAAVAARWDVAPEDVGKRHAAHEFVVAFCGFSPGFAYVAGLSDDLAVPRLESPRSKVPAGSVGLAGSLTGIYPRESPGGWQLIGRTDVVLWRELEASPALLTPGTRVRFVPDD